MSTKDSPIEKLMGEAIGIARMLKRIEGGESPRKSDPIGKIAAARKTDRLKSVIAMDDGFRPLEMTWVHIRETAEEVLREEIIAIMQKKA